MTRSLLRIVFALCGLTASASLAAQAKRFAITGTVKDSSQSSLLYTTISIYKAGAVQQALRTTYSNDKGSLRLAALDTGSYLLLVSHTGFAEKQLPVALTDKDADLGVLLLERASTV